MSLVLCKILENTPKATIINNKNEYHLIQHIHIIQMYIDYICIIEYNKRNNNDPSTCVTNNKS